MTNLDFAKAAQITQHVFEEIATQARTLATGLQTAAAGITPPGKSVQYLSATAEQLSAAALAVDELHK